MCPSCLGLSLHFLVRSALGDAGVPVLNDVSLEVRDLIDLFPGIWVCLRSNVLLAVRLFGDEERSMKSKGLARDPYCL